MILVSQVSDCPSCGQCCFHSHCNVGYVQKRNHIGRNSWKVHCGLHGRMNYYVIVVMVVVKLFYS